MRSQVRFQFTWAAKVGKGISGRGNSICKVTYVISHNPYSCH